MPVPTPDAWAQIRAAYEHSDTPVEDICLEHGISSTTLRNRMRRWGWTRRRPPIPRDGPPPVAMRPSATDDCHPPLEGEGEDVQAAPVQPNPPSPPEDEDPAAIVPRLQSAVGRVLPAIEATIARLAAGAHHPREMEQAGRALSALTRTLRELNALLAQQQARAAEDGDYTPRDIDEIRAELAQRLHALIDAERDKQEEAKPEETW